MPLHANHKLLSHSSSLTLHCCPQKFNLDKILPVDPAYEDDEGGHFVHGTAVGAAVQAYLVTGSKQAAYFAAAVDWDDDLEEEKATSIKKSFWWSLAAIDHFITKWENEYATDFELVSFQDKPAIELGFRIDCGEGFFYRGFLDALLRNKKTNEFIVLELKTTRNREVHDAVYANSGQPLGYSLIVDAISHFIGTEEVSSYSIFYFIWKTSAQEWEVKEYTKTKVSRAKWIKNILLDMKHIAEFGEEDYWPEYGESCYAFFRPCKYFEVCSFSEKTLLVGKAVVVKADDPSKYQFLFTIDELIEAQLAL